MSNTHAAWQPTASRQALVARQAMLSAIRTFFSERNVLEVETPLLARTSSLDPYITSIQADVNGMPFYLQTSPEFHMKRLLSCYQVSMFQICKAFRQDEKGRYHNPEFTLLEWYRIDFSLHDLIQEVIALCQCVLGEIKIEHKSYDEVFKHFMDFSPLQVNLDDLKYIVEKHGIQLTAKSQQDLSKDDWLDLCFTHVIEPQLHGLWVIDHYPESQKALAQVISIGGHRVAERFEVYINGVELANGYHELRDPIEQKKRFLDDLAKRQMLGLPVLPIDKCLLDALPFLPDCSGVALGVDRLLMLREKYMSIDASLSFTISNA